MRLRIIGVPLWLVGLLAVLAALPLLTAGLAVLDQSPTDAGSSSAGAGLTPLERIEGAEGRMNDAADRLGRAVEGGNPSTAQEAVEEIEGEYLEAVDAWANMPTSERDALAERIDGLLTLRDGAHETLRVRFGIELP